MKIPVNVMPRLDRGIQEYAERTGFSNRIYSTGRSDRLKDCRNDAIELKCFLVNDLESAKII
ncbi:MAG: hypothetical protein C4581_05785 [Nitrospiraceae bacterium]|nr:MAG: hypothetical protein C4581_05785 [Nitrospiraceae bacterium]